MQDCLSGSSVHSEAFLWPTFKNLTPSDVLTLSLSLPPSLSLSLSLPLSVSLSEM